MISCIILLQNFLQENRNELHIQQTAMFKKYKIEKPNFQMTDNRFANNTNIQYYPLRQPILCYKILFRTGSNKRESIYITFNHETYGGWMSP